MVGAREDGECGWEVGPMTLSELWLISGLVVGGIAVALAALVALLVLLQGEGWGRVSPSVGSGPGRRGGRPPPRRPRSRH